MRSGVKPTSYQVQVRIFEAAGCKYVRTQGDHLVDHYPGAKRPVVIPKYREVESHMHRSLERRLVGTSEVVIIKKGRCVIDIFNDDLELVANRELYPGDLMLMVGRGHGFRMSEDTVLLEVKQGPYTGIDEKQRL